MANQHLKHIFREIIGITAGLFVFIALMAGCSGNQLVEETVQSKYVTYSDEFFFKY